MWFRIIVLVVVVAGASATSPRRLPPNCPFPSGPYVQPDCGPNAYFEVCSFPCPAQNCSTFWSAYECDPNACCKPECRCKNGFLRDDRSGLCIPQDECFSPCGPLEEFVRGSTDCQKTCANYKVSGPKGICKPFTGCVCKKGRVRLNDDGTGVCVLPQQCPSRKCPIFEHWEDCPSVCHKETCISKSPDYKCLLPAIPLPCKPRCVCDKGYSRDTFGRCIPDSNCPTKKCPINEVWRCAQICARDSCASLEKGFKCPPGIVSVCIPACACKDGYLRNEKGVCIPKDLCPASLRCGINEVAVPCATTYPPQTCESIYTLYKPVKNPPCNPGCDCRPGYLRNKRNICVPKEFCPAVPPNKCAPFQEYKDCGTACEPSCATLDNPNQVCTDQCVAGCFCKDGYIKDDEGNCIPRDQCPLPVCNKPNEVAKECGSYCEIKTCEDYNNTGVVCPAVCVRGCFCRKGYVRNAYGVCVLPKQCPKKPVCLQDNEEYQSCGSSCPDNCNNYQDTGRICTQNCVPGCNCKKGFVRNLDDNTCVKPEQCPSNNCTGQNESLNLCSSYCPVTCANRLTVGDWACATVCRVACDCVPGTLRNDSGVCVPVDQCSPPVCRQNEKFQKCGTACPLTCDNYKNPPQVCTQQCVEDCFCQDGYVRDRNMRCVKPENCEPICPTGERFNECSAHCQDTCENYDKPDRICTYQCQSGCVCEPGTVRRNDGKCVPPLECSPQPTCADDTEVYSQCSAHCEPTCENSDPNQACTRICKSGCKCADGLVRRSDGQCVKVEECSPPQPTCANDTEVYSPCSSHCEPTCENSSPNQPCTRICKPGCKCADGFVRRSDGQCVKVEECSPPQPTCASDTEVYSPCSSHCEPTCENSSPNQPCTRICKPGCKCADGFVRRNDGQCVKVEECSQPTCSGDEVFDPCSAHCEPTCENNGPNRACTAICKPGCKCGEGLVRRKDGQCVKLKDCSAEPSCPAQEIFDQCSAHCEPTCENNGPNRACTDICKPGCKCADGLVRRNDGQCVPLEECTPQPQCPTNERWVGCVIGLCSPKTCDELGYPVACPGIIGSCEGGCVCIENYLRNSDGVCIPQKDCPSCGGDFNATAGCGSNCGNLCSNYNKPNNCSSIPLYCQFNGCDCKEGFVFDSVIQRCVSPINCPIPCNGDIYAEKVDCASNCPPTCAQPKPGICNRACSADGCRCRDGYIKGPDGKCVKVENCPADLGCNGDPNAIVRTCPSACPLTCENPDLNRPCPAICLPTGCECKYGYILSEPGGKCIKPDQCKKPQACSDPNAIRKKCAVAESCKGTCAVPNAKVCPKICVVDGCECKPGYVLDKSGGKCIPIDQCPRGNPCGTFATFVPCRVNCPDGECPIDDSRGIIACDPPYPCPSGCSCNLNYKRRSYNNDTCILASDCPPVKCTRPNEVWSSCPSPCLRENCADNNGLPKYCKASPLNCQPRCICKSKHFRNDEDICVPAKECPNNNQTCSDPNAERVECAPAPQCRSTCAKPDPGPCILSCAVNECVCKKGFVLSAPGGKCVPVDQCPKDAPCNGDANAVIKANPLACPSTCSSPEAQPFCKRAAPDVGCECKPGYLKSNDTFNSKCVKADDCPGGNPCGANGTFVFCNSNCPTNNCPVTDTRAIIACSIAYPCPSGCACKVNYRRKSSTDRQCILASECPPVKCTRPNEVWSPCPSDCLAENCADINNQPTTCNTLLLNCQPKCICQKGYFRNDSDICVPAKQCPGNQACSDPNAERIECAPAPQCRSTCAKPNPGPCILSCAVNECVCKKGYVLSAPGGTCVPIDQCPKDTSCNGDENAVIKANPLACPSTCTSPDAQPYCKKLGPAVGCECKPGYLKSGDEFDSKCIKADDCKGGNPCGVNGTFVWCNVGCPTNNCPTSDSRAIIACSPPFPCPSGCACKLNHRRRSYDNRQCILASDCPPVNCTRPNEVWSPCPSACLRENCADVNNQPTTCNTLVLNCQPQCICKKGHFRNDAGICVPANKCSNNQQQCSDPNAERVDCAPAPDCRPTCGSSNNGPCILSCAVDNCVCKKGYILSEKGGKCIPVDQCPKIPCGKNETYVACKVDCPTNNCPTALNQDLIICDPAYPCPGGCICKPNYKRSNTNKQCILASECPPLQCKANEEWSSCPSACLAENCADVGKPPVTCNTLLLNCQPKCICKKGYYRDANRNCVPANKCPKPIQCKANEVYSPCRITCPPQTCASIYTSYSCLQAVQCEPGCDCKDGYLRNGTVTDLCIPSEKCPAPQPVCGDNESYQSCGSACPPTCKNQGDTCTACTLQCVAGCFCNKGYVRADDGTCVKASSCPKPTCGPNETFDPCPPTCPPTDGCSNLWSKFNCTGAVQCCKPQCRCNPGYLRKGSKCVPTKQCTSNTPDCGLNEHYEENRSKCDLTCKNKDQQAQIGPCQETSGCFCDDGYYRNTNGICVAEEQCPKPITCPANEVVSECYNTCHTTCKTRFRTDGRVCSLACVDTGCLCIPGYLRHDNGTCVPVNECSPPNCNKNESYTACGTACPTTCQNKADNCTVCTKQCVEGCFCNKGYVRSDIDNACAKPRDCPVPTCNDPNEIFDSCPPTCPPTDNCSNLWSKFDCSKASKCCKAQCRCKPGYYRNDQGKCITTQQCINGEDTT